MVPRFKLQFLRLQSQHSYPRIILTVTLWMHVHDQVPISYSWNQWFSAKGSFLQDGLQRAIVNHLSPAIMKFSPTKLPTLQWETSEIPIFWVYMSDSLELFPKSFQCRYTPIHYPQWGARYVWTPLRDLALDLQEWTVEDPWRYCPLTLEKMVFSSHGSKVLKPHFLAGPCMRMWLPTQRLSPVVTSIYSWPHTERLVCAR